MQNNVRIGYVNTEGDTLYYEVRGKGDALLMIPGGGGDAGYYCNVVDILSNIYQVITYDRRGNSRSTRNDPQNFDIGQQARDALAVMQAAGHSSACVFGNSAGAIIALELAKSHKNSVKTAVVHEPPVIRMLHEANELLAKFASWYSIAYNENYQKAMELFMSTAVLSPSIYTCFPQELIARIDQNNEFFVKSEMIPLVNYKPDIEIIRNNGVKMVMAAGKITLDAKAYYGITAPIIANLLNCEMAVFPGHHLSYIDMPKEWSDKLKEVL